MTAVTIIGTDLPGRRVGGPGDVHVGIQRGSDVEQLVPADASRAEFVLDVAPRTARDGRLDYGGPYVHGPIGDRFLYLSWGEVGGGGQFAMFRRAKVRLGTVPAEIAAALAEGHAVVGELRLTDERGGPLCASVPATSVAWSTSSR
ncbi:MAG: DUF5990 family protein [bacterium]